MTKPERATVNENLINLREARERLGIGRHVMADLIAAGEIPVYRLSPRSTMVKPSDLERFIAKRASPPPKAGRRSQVDRFVALLDGD